MKLIETSLPDVKVLEPQVFGDSRGFFMETYSSRKFADFGVNTVFVQDNHSLSAQHTLRGLHYQLNHPQAKLCRVTKGAVLDVAVDIRVGSPTFGQHAAVELSEENRRMILIPHGFAHGFVVLTETAEFLYKCDDFYVPGDEYGVAWNDPALGIDWKLSAPPLLSPKDTLLPLLSDIPTRNLPAFKHS